MKTTICYKFNLQAIKNHTHFLVQKDIFPSVYFIPMDKQVLFISPCQENVYMTLSNENKEGVKINNYINNIVEDNTLNFNHVFAINKKDFKGFLKNANKNDSFYFDITLQDQNISGNCSILKAKKEINEADIPFIGTVDIKNSEDYYVNLLLQFLLFTNFNFKEINWNKSILNINLRYYSSINNSLNAYKDELKNIKIFNDETNKVTSVNIYADDIINVYSSQILIAHCYSDYSNSDSNKDVLTKVRNYFIAAAK